MPGSRPRGATEDRPAQRARNAERESIAATADPGRFRRVQLVVVSSLGNGQEPHWSHAVAAELVGQALARGFAVRWLAPRHAGHALPALPGEGTRCVVREVFERGRPTPLARVASGYRDVQLEIVLTGWLRELPRAPVVHVGLGARGSPNALWLADRLGSRAFAVARGAEVVCHRGDLVDRDGRRCEEYEDPERCRWCCTGPWWRRPRVDDFANRIDLMAASLLAAESVAVSTDADRALLAELGVPAPRIVVAENSVLLLARIEAGLARR